MHPLAYKQQRQLANAVWRTLQSPRRLIAALVVLGYGALTMGVIAALVVLPLPDTLGDLLNAFGLSTDIQAQLQGVRGALTITLLMISSLAVFQNPLLRFASADIDLLFTAPIPLWRVMLGRIMMNHLRTLLAAYFFWGLALVPLLRLGGYTVWPVGLWGMLGVLLVFSSVDQFFAGVQLALLRRDTLQRPDPAAGVPAGGAALWLIRGVLVVVLGLLLLLVVGVIERLLLGTWTLLGGMLVFVGDILARSLLLPLGLVADLLLLPVDGGTVPWLAVLVLFLIDLLTVGLLLRQVQLGGAGLLLETSLAPDGRPSRLDDLLRAVGFNPLRLLRVLWYDEWEAEQQPGQTITGIARFGTGERAHLWRRLTELLRTPLRNGLAVLVLGLIPLALYNPAEGYNLGRLLTAMIFSASLGTQLFNDAADHLRYANLELSTPAARWRLLVYAFAPRLALYWLGGLLLLGGVGLLAPGADYADLLALFFWYPLLLIPLLALRGALVFFYPAAGLPGQRDPVQAMLVTLLNGFLVIGVIMLSLLPFTVLLALVEFFAIGRVWFWPVIYLGSVLLCAACCALLLWSYQRYEPGE